MSKMDLLVPYYQLLHVHFIRISTHYPAITVFSMAGDLRPCAVTTAVCFGIQRTIKDLEAGSRRASSQSISFKDRKKQFYSALWLTFTYPVFPVINLLAATKVIGPGDSVGIIFLLLTLLMKAAFAATLADMHTQTFADALREFELVWDRQASVNELEKENDMRISLVGTF